MSFFNKKQAKYGFGNTSSKELVTCDPKLQEILNEAIRYINFSVVSGHRNEEQQNSKYPKYTKLKFPNSKHNSYPSKGVDIAPYIQPYGVIFGSKEQLEQISILSGRSEEAAKLFVLKSYGRLIGHIERIAQDKGIDIVLGMDWDMDFDTLDQTFDDLGHIELKD